MKGYTVSFTSDEVIELIEILVEAAETRLCNLSDSNTRPSMMQAAHKYVAADNLQLKMMKAQDVGEDPVV